MIAGVLAELAARGLSLAVAESLTGGLVAAAVVSVPGASDVFRGGVVAYATEVKATLLEVPTDLLAARGPVDPEVAVAMAQGVAKVLGADVGVATTGVAGPDSQGGQAPGTVFVAVTLVGGLSEVRALNIPGDRAAVRDAATVAAIELVAEVLADSSD